MKSVLNLPESYGPKSYNGELEFEVRDVRGRTLRKWREPNLVKIFAKEILSHRIAPARVWDPNADSGAGGYVTHDIDLDEFSLKYIVFGASFDDNGAPLDTADTRFYTQDSVSGAFVPISLGVGAEYDGGLVNPIPISEPTRPLKRVERIFFENSYQPAGTPLLQADVRCINNVVVLETTLTKEEYNGLGVTGSDFFTLTEVALIGAEERDSVGACECDPRDIFLKGSADGGALLASANGTATVNLSITESEVDLIKEGDQVKIVAAESTAADDAELDQVSPYYLVVDKALGGRDITLDRVPVDSDNVALSGDIGLLRDGFRIFSHRILKTPVKKSEDFEIVVRWRIILN